MSASPLDCPLTPEHLDMQSNYLLGDSSNPKRHHPAPHKHIQSLQITNQLSDNKLKTNVNSIEANVQQMLIRLKQKQSTKVAANVNSIEAKTEHNMIIIDIPSHTSDTTVDNYKKKAKYLKSVYQRFVTYWFKGQCSRKSPNKMYLIFYNLFAPFFVIATAAAFAYLLKMPFIFPSLGPTAFLHFAIPDKPPSSPKHTLIGHFIGIMAGSLSLQITNLYDNDSIFNEGVVFERIWCSALSVGITCSVMILCHVEHPPAGASTLIVSLGILKTPFELTIMMLAVLLLTVEAFIINRLFRKDAIYPVWSAPKQIIRRNDGSVPRLLKGFSNMSLSNMNLPRKKLNDMQSTLGLNNFIEYFKICNEIGSGDEMRFLLNFAKQNKERIEELDGYAEIVSLGTRFSGLLSNLNNGIMFDC